MIEKYEILVIDWETAYNIVKTKTAHCNLTQHLVGFHHEFVLDEFEKVIAGCLTDRKLRLGFHLTKFRFSNLLMQALEL